MFKKKLNLWSFIKLQKSFSYRRLVIYEILRSYLSLQPYSILDIGGTIKTKKILTNHIINKESIFENLNPDKKNKPDIVAYGEKTKFKNNTLDVVTVIEVLQYVNEIKPILQEAKRIVKKKGLVIATFPFLYPELDDYVDRNRLTFKQINLILREIFNKVKVHNCGGILGTIGMMIQLRSLKINNKFYSRLLNLFSYILCYTDFKFNNFNKKNIFTNGYIVILKK